MHGMFWKAILVFFGQVGTILKWNAMFLMKLVQYLIHTELGRRPPYHFFAQNDQPIDSCLGCVKLFQRHIQGLTERSTTRAGGSPICGSGVRYRMGSALAHGSYGGRS